jgi:hypothetical protein
MILAPEVETRPWEEQRALDDTAYREQLAYLLERSPFYREKLGAAGVPQAGDAGGLDDIGRLPLTEKQELRATATPENPVGAHLCAAREEIVRIYSTSGTTGTPSYIPLTASDLENWITGSARSYAASGIEPGQRIVSTYNAGPFAAGAALASFERVGLCHIPVGTGNTERLMRAIELLRPEAAVLTPSYAAHLVEWAAERDMDLAGSSVALVLVAGEPAGARASPRRWGSATSASRCGASARSRTACTSAPAGSSTPSSSIRRAARRSRWRTARRASSSSPICATGPRRCCASGPATTSSCAPTRARAGGPARACAASGAPTTC